MPNLSITPFHIFYSSGSGHLKNLFSFSFILKTSLDEDLCIVRILNCEQEQRQRRMPQKTYS